MDEVRIATIGNVDSAKSTTISVLKNNILDDGRGSARSKILKHRHEQDSGRTSCVTSVFYKNSNKIINFVDLAGHKRYLKTTILGLNGYGINYAMVLIGANMGVKRMTKEHLGLAMAMRKPIIIVFTKIDTF